MTYTYCCEYSENSRCWTEELSETCRVSFQNKYENLVHLFGFIIRNLSRCTVTWTPNVKEYFISVNLLGHYIFENIRLLQG